MTCWILSNQGSGISIRWTRATTCCDAQIHSHTWVCLPRLPDNMALDDDPGAGRSDVAGNARRRGRLESDVDSTGHAPDPCTAVAFRTEAHARVRSSCRPPAPSARLRWTRRASREQDTAADSTRPKTGIRDHASALLWRFPCFLPCPSGRRSTNGGTAAVWQLIATLTVAQVAVQVGLNSWSARLYNAIEGRHLEAFLGLIETFVLLLLASILVFSITLYTKRRLEFAWRVWITKNTLSVWMAQGQTLSARPGRRATRHRATIRTGESPRIFA